MNGTVAVEDNRIFVPVPNDLREFYTYLLRKRISPLNQAVPNVGKHEAHITVANEATHRSWEGWDYIDDVRSELEGVRVSYSYNPDIRVGGHTRNFWNFYLNVQSDQIIELKRNWALALNRTHGLHITLANTKGAKHPKIPLYFES